MLLALQDEIRRSEEARYDHRLHGVLLVAQGMNAPKVARLLGDGVRTVEYWVERFNEDGFAGLVEGERPGRPRKLSIEQLEELEVILRASPRAQGVSAKVQGRIRHKRRPSPRSRGPSIYLVSPLTSHRSAL
jgi:transposase